jgi:type IV secretory pathway VirB4 component
LQWLQRILESNNVQVDSVTQNQLKETLAKLSRHSIGKEGRSLSDFRNVCPSQKVKEGLEYYVGTILDGERDDISMNRFCVFEMDRIYRLNPKLMNGAMFYIYAKIRKRFHSSIPTLVTIDEFREALNHPIAADATSEFLYEGRKMNAAVWVALQDMARLEESTLAMAVKQQCFTKVFLSNAQAVAGGKQAYLDLGLEDRDCAIIAQAERKSEYYVTSDYGRRLISLELGPVALSFVAASSDSDREEVDRLSQMYGRSWPAIWLKQRGLTDWGDRLEQIYLQQQEELIRA